MWPCEPGPVNPPFAGPGSDAVTMRSGRTNGEALDAVIWGGTASGRTLADELAMVDRTDEFHPCL